MVVFSILQPPYIDVSLVDCKISKLYHVVEMAFFNVCRAQCMEVSHGTPLNTLVKSLLTLCLYKFFSAFHKIYLGVLPKKKKSLLHQLSQNSNLVPSGQMNVLQFIVLKPSLWYHSQCFMHLSESYNNITPFKFVPPLDILKFIFF